MAHELSFYTSPSAMEPLFPEDDKAYLENLATELIEKAGKLSGSLNPITRTAIADFLRPMNSYYSNLIEGHDTHPIDISRAMHNVYSEDKRKRDLQKEANAHINVHKTLSTICWDESPHGLPSSITFLNYLHREFYLHLPEDFKKTKTKEGSVKIVHPGRFRTDEVEIGRHVAPLSSSLDAFMKRFESFYDPTTSSNALKAKRIVAIAAAHHRLAWIHPYLDGNGRVVRLFSDACFMYEHLHASGLWSISRGLARSKEHYQAALANADLKRENNYDGRGNLSNKMLVNFCTFFLKTAIDQVEYMYRMMDTEGMLSRIGKFTELMATKDILKPTARHILEDVFLKGKISRADALRITGKSDKTVKAITDQLIELELITSKMEGSVMMYYVNYPIRFSPYLFPGLYPSHREMDMWE